MRSSFDPDEFHRSHSGIAIDSQRSHSGTCIIIVVAIDYRINRFMLSEKP